MSIHVMAAVFERYQVGGSEKLVMLALADWCGDDGENLYPSVASIASKCCMSESQARRVLRDLEEKQLLHCIGNHNGGAGKSRQYRLDVAALWAMPLLEHAEKQAERRSAKNPSAGDTLLKNPSAHAHETLAPMRENPSAGDTLTIKNHQKNHQIPTDLFGDKKTGKRKITLREYIAQQDAAGKDHLEGTDPVFAYADRIKLPDSFVAIAWHQFTRSYLDSNKRYYVWPQVFRNAIERNWYKLWYIGDGGQYQLTTVGLQTERDLKAHSSPTAAAA